MRCSSSFLAVLLTFAFGLLSGPAHAGAGQDPAAEMARMLHDLAGPEEPGVAAAVLLDGVVAAAAEAGLADMEQAAPITRTTVFHAASLSKQFTAFALLLLEQDGALSIDDPVSTYIPEMAGSPPVSLRRLMNHTNGQRDLATLLAVAGWRSEDLVTNQQALDMVLAQRGLNFAPGAAFQYNNADYVLLAEVVRRVSGQSLAAFCQARIFEPLGMTHTRFVDDPAVLQLGSAQSYEPVGNAFRHRVLSNVVTGPTGLKTTAEDLLRWAANFESGQVGGEALFRRMETLGRLDDGSETFYALGQERHWHRGLPVWSHGGRDAGFRSYLVRIPGKRLAVAVLANRSDIDASVLAFRIADLFLPALAQEAGDHTAPSQSDLAAYAGVYELFPGLLLNFSADGDRLRLSVAGQTPVVLPALSHDTFALDEETNLSIRFAPPVSGRSARLDYVLGLNGTLSAARVELAPFAPSEVRLDDYAGRFRSAELKTEYVLDIVDDGLVARHPRRPPAPLRPYQPDTFAGDLGLPVRLDFQRDSHGRVAGFVLSGPVADGVRFERVPEE